MGFTAAQYFNLKTQCSVTPTFRYVSPYIMGKSLDIGTGTGEYLEKFPAGSIGLDVSDENVRIIEEKKLEVVKSDINQGLPFEERYFETVFCSHVIEHVDSPLNLLREAHRVLKSRGHIILAVPLEKTLARLFRDKYFKDHPGHLYGLSVECVEKLFEMTGFKCVAKYYNFPIVNRIAFIDRILQIIAGNYCQSFCTMYWIVGVKQKP